MSNIAEKFDRRTLNVAQIPTHKPNKPNKLNRLNKPNEPAQLMDIPYHRVNHLLSPRYSGRPLRTHDGSVITPRSNMRWCS